MSIDYFSVACNDARAAGRRVRITADEVEAGIQAEAQRDHELAKSRGERIRSIAGCVASDLFAAGRITNKPDLERDLIQALAAHLYPGVSVDI